MGILVWILVCLICLLLCINWRRKYSYWIRQNVPQLPAVPILGSFVPFNKPLQELEIEHYKRHGRIYGRYDGSTPVLTVADPQLLKRILVKDFHLFSSRRDMKFNDPVVDNTLFSLEGEDWKRVRSIVSPTLTSAKLKRMLPMMEESSEILIQNIRQTLKNNRTINVQRFFGAYVIDTIAKCAFGININSLTNKDHPFVKKANRLLDCNFGWRTIVTMTCPGLMKVFHIRLLNPDTTQFYSQIIIDVIAEKRRKRGREDFLQMLLDNEATDAAQDMNNNNVKEKGDESSSSCDELFNHSSSSDVTQSISTANNYVPLSVINQNILSATDQSTSSATIQDISSITNQSISSSINQNTSSNSSQNTSSTTSQSTSSPSNNSRALSHDEIVAQCVTFFMAGYESTTSLLSHAVYNLAMNQDYQDRVVEEIQTALKEQNGELNYETLSKLKFMEAVLNECLRLCPSMVRNERRVDSDCTLADTNIKLKKGMLISIPMYAMHRDPEWFPEPNEFKPERFYETDPNRPQYVHLPFGGGPRICVGFRFVMMQVKLCLAKVLLKFRAQPGPTTPARLGVTEIRNVLKVNEVEISLVERIETLTKDSSQLKRSKESTFA